MLLLLLWLLLFASRVTGGVVIGLGHYSVPAVVWLLALHLLVHFVEVLELIVSLRLAKLLFSGGLSAVRYDISQQDGFHIDSQVGGGDGFSSSGAVGVHIILLGHLNFFG